MFIQEQPCPQPVVTCFCRWRFGEDQNVDHCLNSRVNYTSKLISNMKSKIKDQCLINFSLMLVIFINFPHKILTCMSTNIDRLWTWLASTSLQYLCNLAKAFLAYPCRELVLVDYSSTECCHQLGQ